jgi:hypothetical protein
MLQKIFSISVTTKHDMSKLEEVIVALLGGEHNKCSFTRSKEFVQLRLQALYPRKQDGVRTKNLSVYGEGLKITLTPTGLACVFVTDPCFEPFLLCSEDAPDPLGKRSSARPWDCDSPTSEPTPL